MDLRKSSLSGLPDAASSVEADSSLEEVLGEGQELVPVLTKTKILKFFGLKQRFRGNGPSLSCILNRCDPHTVSLVASEAASSVLQREVSFALYLIEVTKEFMVENIEIPTSSLLAMLCVVPLLRPIFVRRPHRRRCTVSSAADHVRPPFHHRDRECSACSAARDELASCRRYRRCTSSAPSSSYSRWPAAPTRGRVPPRKQ